MNDFISKLIYLIIMPCSKATLELEKEHAGYLSRWKSIRLKLHLHVCNLCAAYSKKIAIIDRQIEKKTAEQKFQPSEIEHFIEDTQKKLEKS